MIKEEVGSEVEKPISGWGYRHSQCVILFFCLTIAYSMRSCMGVAMVAMIDDYHGANQMANGNQTHSRINNESFNQNDSVNQNNSMVGIGSNIDIAGNDSQVFENDETSKTHGLLNGLLLTPPYPLLKWSKKKQDTVLSALFWGYMLLLIPAGHLVPKVGSRRFLSGALALNGVVSFCFPWAAYYGGWICALTCRLLQGLGQAVILPSLHNFFGKWLPLEERSRLAGFVLGGQAVGTVLGLPITGFLAASPLGWPGIFRFHGLLAGITGVVVFFMLADCPAVHSKISMVERRYIEEGLGQKGGDQSKQIPWVQILRSPGMWAIVSGHIGVVWGQLTLYTEVPAYMAKVMGVNIKANGMLTALPFLVMWFTSFFFNWFTDMVIVRKILSPTNARKMANSLGAIPAGIGLIVLAYVPKNIYVVETILVIICAFKISSHVGCLVSHIDISPNYAGTMIGVSNCIANVFGSQAPLVAGFILTDVTSEYQWRKVFFVAAGFFLITNVVYCVLGTAEKATWDSTREEETMENEHDTEQLMKRTETK